jgi:hypothetical protein
MSYKPTMSVFEITSEKVKSKAIPITGLGDP